MEWDVEATDEFRAWWEALTEAEQASIRAVVVLLIEFGPNLGFPHSSKVNGSRYSADKNVPMADRIYGEYLKELQEEDDAQTD